MKRLSAALLLVSLLPFPALGGDLATAADVTERGRSLDFILDALLVPREPPPPEGRTVVLLLDPTPSLGAAGFAGAFRSALLRNRERLAGTRIAVASVAAPEAFSPLPADVADPLDDAVRRIVREPVRDLQNVYGAVRAAAAKLAGSAGTREVILVTLENGDAEDDLEKTVAAAAGAEVAVSVLAREAFLSDTWWFRRPRRDLEDLKLAGADSAFIEMPWSCLLQWTVANEIVPSGFAMFGLTRLAQGTGGRVFVYYPAAAAASRCATAGQWCFPCREDHDACGEGYQAHRLRAIAPLIGPRDEVGRVVGRDPCFQALQAAWVQAAKEGVFMFEPSVDWAAGGLKDADLERGHLVLLGDSLAFGVQAKRAERLAKAAEGVARELDRALGFAGEEGLPRYRAMAETTRVLLLLTAFNLRQYAAFCREVGPDWVERQDAEAWTPPEVPALRSDYLYYRIWFGNLCLCHGAEPYRDLRFPGGRRADQDLEDLTGEIAAFLRRHANTPFAQLIRKQGLVRCYLAGTAKGGTPARWVPAAKSSETATNAVPRPGRAGPASGGSGGGATSGGR